MTKAEQCADGKGEVMDKYDRDCLAKLAFVVEAALANDPLAQKIEISTSGYDPFMRTTIPAYLLKKILDDTK